MQILASLCGLTKRVRSLALTADSFPEEQFLTAFFNALGSERTTSCVIEVEGKWKVNFQWSGLNPTGDDDVETDFSTDGGGDGHGGS